MDSSINNLIALITLSLLLFCYTTFAQDINQSIVIDEKDEGLIEAVQDSQSLILEPQPAPKQWTIGNKKLVFKKSINQKQVLPCEKYKKGKGISKAGLITGIIGSGILTATVVYAFNNHDPYGEIAIPGVVGITSSIISVNLTTIGLIIKSCNKDDCLDKN